MRDDFKDLDDPLDDLLNGEPPTQPITPNPKHSKEHPDGGYKCEKCGGSGSWRGRGNCFACGGSGKRKTSAEHRAKAKVTRAVNLAAKIEAFKIERKVEYAWMTSQAPRFEFAANMLEALGEYGSLTDAQLNAVQKCVARSNARDLERKEREAHAARVDITKIEHAFAHARQIELERKPGAKGVWTRPLKLRANDVDIVVKAGTGKWEGTIFVERGEDSLGKIKDGRFIRYPGCTDTLEAAVIKACSDPHIAAKAWALAYSQCGICGQTLTAAESIERGIGPICASKYGW